MPNVCKTQADAVADFHHFHIVTGNEVLHNGCGFCCGVKRFKGRCAGTFCLSVPPLGFKFLNVGTV